MKFKKGLIPQHVAIVMDGNRRWAKERGLSYDKGHIEGAQRVDELVELAVELGVRALTLYAFSTENWLRSKAEVAVLMALLEKYLKSKLPYLIEKGVRLHCIGRISQFPTHIQDVIAEACEATESGTNIDLILALNYGARDEICRAAEKFAQDCVNGIKKPGQISEKCFANYLDTARWPDPELLIRTSGEMRLSNFLLWQISYSEVYITKTLWPDFSKDDFARALQEYQNRKRRFGK